MEKKQTTNMESIKKINSICKAVLKLTEEVYEVSDSMKRIIAGSPEKQGWVKTLSECKDEVAQKHGFEDWSHACGIKEEGVGFYFDEISELYARQFQDQWIEMPKELNPVNGYGWFIVKYKNSKSQYDAITGDFLNGHYQLYSHYMPLPQKPEV